MSLASIVTQTANLSDDNKCPADHLLPLVKPGCLISLHTCTNFTKSIDANHKI